MWLHPPPSECSHWRLATVSTITLAAALTVIRNCKMRTIVGGPLGNNTPSSRLATKSVPTDNIRAAIIDEGDLSHEKASILSSRIHKAVGNRTCGSHLYAVADRDSRGRA